MHLRGYGINAGFHTKYEKKKKKTIPKKFQKDMMTNMTYMKVKFVYK